MSARKATLGGKRMSEEVSLFRIDGNVVFSGQVKAQDKRRAKRKFEQYIHEVEGIAYTKPASAKVVAEDVGFGKYHCQYMLGASAIDWGGERK